MSPLPTTPFAVRNAFGEWVAARAANEPANAKVVRRLYECLNSRDEDCVLALYAPSPEIHSFVGAVDGSKLTGRSGARQWYRNLVDTLEMKIEPRELMAYKHYVLSITTVQISVGGKRQLFEAGMVYELADGRIKRSFGYGKVGAAVKKLGSLLHGEHELAV